MAASLITLLPLASAEPGRGELAFERVGERTVVSRAFANSPLGWLMPRSGGRAAWVFGTSHGGGLVGGDALVVGVQVGEGATGLISTQASTKVYRSVETSSQRLEAEVGDGGLLVLLPEPVVCFAGARYAQEVNVLLQPGASLVLVDGITCGRRASGERWAFARYRSQLTVWQGGRRLLHDVLLLDPAHGPLGPRLGEVSTLALAVVVGERLAGVARGLVDEIAAEAAPRSGARATVASRIGDGGALLRVAGPTTESVWLELRARLDFLVPLLGDDPWLRKC